MSKKILHKFKSASVGTRVRGIIILSVLLLLPMGLLIFSPKTNNKNTHDTTFLIHNKTFRIPIPKNIRFANEKIPVYDFKVLENMEKELMVNSYNNSPTILLHKRANRWLPLIASILKRYNIPDDFKYIPIVESNLTNSVSSKEAAGFWQFLPATGKQYGLEIDEAVDERYNVEKSTEAACRYFKDAYVVFHNWTLVAASYNLGMDGLRTQLIQQKADSYYNLYLNKETSRYIYKIIAVKEVISKPEDYGFHFNKKDLYPVIPTQKIKVDSTIANLPDFAIKLNSNYKVLKYFNPWIKDDCLPNKDNKTYFIKLPKPGYNEEYITYLVSEDSTVTGAENLPDNNPALYDSASNNE